MATSIDTGLTANARRAHIFTMSDGNLVAVYYNGTGWGYRIKAGGTWGARVALASSPTGQGAVFRQDGDNIFGAVSGPPFFYIYKLAYNAASDAITQTNTLTGDNAVVLAAYVDTTNARFNVPVLLSDAGVYLYSFATSNLAAGIAAVQITATSPPTTNQTDVTYAAAGDGTGTWYLAWCDTAGSTALKVVQLVTTTTAITSQTAETNVPALAANCQGLDAIYDGTNVVIAANQNNAALRVTRRTAANTYDAWSTLVTETIGGAPSLAKKGTGANADLLVAYQSKAAQANGEIATFKRLSGAWDATKTTLAGGAATGWGNPVTARSDLNQGTAGTVPVVYVTGTANPWALVEDSTVISGGGTNAAVAAVPAVAAGAAPIAVVSGGGANVSVGGVPAVAAGSTAPAGVGAGITVGAVVSVAAGSAPPANSIISVVVNAVAARALGSAPAAFVTAGGAVTVTAVVADAAGSAPVGSVAASVTVGAVVADATGSTPPASFVLGSVVGAAPALAFGSAPRPAVTPQPSGGNAYISLPMTFAEDSV